MQRRKLQVIITSVMLIVVLGTLSSGCGSGDERAVYASNDPPFYPDRVVEVRLVTTEENWASMLETPLAEEYFRADLWYDGELIPDIAVRTKGNSSLMTTASSPKVDPLGSLGCTPIEGEGLQDRVGGLEDEVEGWVPPTTGGIEG